MTTSVDGWVACKEEVLAKLREENFATVYGQLENVRPGSDGWVTACCPLHNDSNPSFSYNPETGQWSCFAGCGKGDVFGFLQEERGESFKEVMLWLCQELGVDPPGSGNERPKTYDYTDENGKLLFQVVRKPGKKWAQRRPGKNGGWAWNVKGVRRVLYRLPELIARPDEPVYVVEGEKDADRLASIGLLATTNPAGAGKWQDKYADTLCGRDVVILPDNDDPGRKHAAQVARSLRGVARAVKIVPLPDLPDKGDVSDWLDWGGSREALEALVAAAEPVAEDADIDEPVSSRPTIDTTDRPLRDIFDDAWAAVLAANDPPQLFTSSGCLARLHDSGRGLQIEFMNKEATVSHLARVADWTRIRRDAVVHVKPTKEAADDLLVNPHPDLPPLEAVITTPVFDAGWRLIDEPGYHPGSRLWLDREPGTDPVTVPRQPNDAEFAAARSLIIDDLLVDFPFAADSDRAHAVAALLLPFARRMFDGPTPIHLIEAPTPGSGKSLLAELVSLVAMGGAPGCTTLTTNEEENRKKLTAILARGGPIISIDNVKDGLWSAQVAAAVTSGVWEDRILGKTQMVSYPIRALWLVSSNNPRLSMEIARRCVRIRIEPVEEKPWKRSGFKHDPIREWVRQNRPALVQALLTVIQHWICAGGPHSDQTMGSFESWSRVIGGMLQHLGLPGFLCGLDELYEAADNESGEWSAFVAAWWDTYHDIPKSAVELLQLAKDRQLVTFAFAARSDHTERVRFGKSLSGLRGRRFGDQQVVMATDTHRKIQVYRLVPVQEELLS
ncbi:MAG: hypothetical protein IH621_18475 [Krumholzibacteria bacterium]|nr:hypothetical protein [Candidatus Krumholzibacteria bacterium]